MTRPCPDEHHGASGLPADRNGRRLPDDETLGAPQRSALERIPTDEFLLTAAHDGRRSGTVVRWVQRCAMEPPMVLVALRKGQPIEPLIRDSRGFALCQIDRGDTLLRRLFADGHDIADDPFISLSVRAAPSGSPIPERAASYLDCELQRQFDIECDYAIYVGAVRDAACLRGTEADAVPPKGRRSRSA